ncbi:hypothetical protein WJX74_008626 [Apatococcus lobatus]|uniref:GCVT N-terminal domain-containing protein n=1 Tax=Apatococcus lobatus TaxID=904363 RepID=A0AAW1SGZ8_9CHLO
MLLQVHLRSAKLCQCSSRHPGLPNRTPTATSRRLYSVQQPSLRPQKLHFYRGILTSASLDDLDLDIPSISEDLGDYQRDAGAYFKDGTSIPEHFGNDAEAYRAAREGVVLVDRSHWGRLRLTGEGRLSFLQGQSTANVLELVPGQSCETVFVNAQARCVDLATCYVSEKGITILVSPCMASRVQAMLEARIFPADQVKIADVSEDTALFSLVGPGSADLLEKLGAGRVMEAGPGEPGRHMLLSCKGSPVLVALGCGLPSPGFTLLVDASAAGELWIALTAQGAVPMGERGWQQLRVKAGRPGAGSELTADWTPLEAGLAGCVSLAKGCYVGQETLAKVHRLAATRHALWGLDLAGPAALGLPILSGGTKVGVLTSCVQLPNGHHAGLGYIRQRGKGIQEGSPEGQEVEVGDVAATIVHIPAAQHTVPDQQLPQKKVEPTQQLGPAGDRLEVGKQDPAKEERLRAMQERLAAWQAQQQA